ncbi:MAG: hypothetical protein IPM07_06595 [Anaerolineales bacterium]|nr:hypothetical protein [Anaerolineales bacterium]
MDKLIARIQALLNHVPGPGKILFGGLTADRQAFRSLAACLLAIVAINLMPPVIRLGSAPIEQGLRQVGSSVPILVAANYLLLAILTLAAGATGDGVGRKLFLLIGLGGVLCAALASMFWLGTDGFIYADLLLSVARITITPMCIAIAAFAFGPGVRPFAFGAIFSTQAIALGSSSALYSVLRSVGNGAIVFLPPIVLGVIAFWLILRRVYEPAEQQRIVWRELLVNLLWAGAVFLAVYGLVAYAGGLTSRNALLTIAVGLGGLILAYRYFYRKLRRRGEIKLYNGRGLAFAILAGMALAMVRTLLLRSGLFAGAQAWPGGNDAAVCALCPGHAGWHVDHRPPLHTLRCAAADRRGAGAFGPRPACLVTHPGGHPAGIPDSPHCVVGAGTRHFRPGAA